ncbi:MAG TPA: LuxR C-terminal-related transcriptional regulator [Bradyrhizobium sp.]|jgi:DNA-binding CsgD family transcriptional regulator|nr:LuxR C-terminal-related transcriptional regulator [Bradyrhizobium sp.]
MFDAGHAIQVDESTSSDDGARHVASITPYAHQMLLISKTADLKQSEAAALVETLNGLAAGIFLVDTDRRIVHANAAGHDILRADDFLRSISGQLVARNTQANRTLDQVFADNGGVAIGTKGIALPLTAHDGERYVMHLLPLTPATRTGIGMAWRAVAALFVRKVALDSRWGELVARTFELTPAERRVLLTIVEVGGVRETSAALGIAESTVKTHLHRVFDKTGARRQADLIKLAAGFSNPLAG